MTYSTIDEIIAANRSLGNHWFDQSTLGFFGSKVYPKIYDGRFFITSEQDEQGFGSLGSAWGGERRFSIREAHEDGSISTVSEFGEYATRHDAVAAVLAK